MEWCHQLSKHLSLSQLPVCSPKHAYASPTCNFKYIIYLNMIQTKRIQFQEETSIFYTSKLECLGYTQWKDAPELPQWIGNMYGNQGRLGGNISQSPNNFYRKLSAWKLVLKFSLYFKNYKIRTQKYSWKFYFFSREKYGILREVKWHLI